MLFSYSLGIGINKTLYDEDRSVIDEGIPDGILIVGTYGRYNPPLVSKPINGYTFADKDTLDYDTTRNDQYTQPVIEITM